MRPPTRVELRFQLHNLLAHAGASGLTEPEILESLGHQYAPNTLQPLLDDLRNAIGIQTTTTLPRRWRLANHDSIPATSRPLTMRHIEFLEEHGIDADLRDELGQLLADLYAKLSEATTAELSPELRKTYAGLLGIKTDPRLILRLMLACGRKSLRILYDNPFEHPPNPTWHDVEPWAVHLEPQATYLRVFLIAEQTPCTFDLAHIVDAADLDIAPPRAPIPEEPWAGDVHGIGPNTDRPGVAVLVIEGEAARYAARERWHPDQHDEWLVPGTRLRRTVPYHNLREITGRAASVVDGLVSLEPPEIAEALHEHLSHAKNITILE